MSRDEWAEFRRLSQERRAAFERDMCGWRGFLFNSYGLVWRVSYYVSALIVCWTVGSLLKLWTHDPFALWACMIAGGGTSLGVFLPGRPFS